MSAFTFVRGFSIFHSGIDLSASKGTPIHAVARGSVIWAANESAAGAPFYVKGGGNVVVIAIGGPLVHVYAHQDSIRAVRGQSMPAGGLVGTVGETGNATGPHLHFAVWDTAQRKAIDPNTYYTTAALIAAVSGTSAPAGGNVILASTPGTVSGAELAFLEAKVKPQIGRQTWHQVFQATGSLDFWNQVNPNNQNVQQLETLLSYLSIDWDKTITAADYGTVVTYLQTTGNAKDLLGGDPLGLGAAVNGLTSGLATVGAHLGQGLVLAVLTFLGLYLLLRGS